MPKVSDLKISIQSGTTNTCVATWDFKEETKSTTTTTSGGGRVKNGDLVSISANATYYNGVAIPAWVKNQKWYIIELSGNRAVLGKNESGTNNIVSAIDVKYLSNGSTGGGSSTTTTTTTEYTKTLDHYTVTWLYDTGDAIWFVGQTSDTSEKYATYTAPSNANRIKVKVLPVAQTHEVNNEQISYWNGTVTEFTYSATAMPPEKPSTPDVTIEQYRLTAVIENISDPRTDQIKFEVYNDTKLVNSGIVNVAVCRATYSCFVEAGKQYRVRAASINIDHQSVIYGAWSEFTNRIGTIPSVPMGITLCQATSKTSVRLEWRSVESAESYDIEYTTESKYFDNSDQTSTSTDITYNHFEITGLETGNEYFFRVRAVNSQGASGWCDIASVVIGKDPEAPTTWSSTTTVVTGEELILYWVHNAADGSSQTYAELELYFDGVKETKVIKSSSDEEDSNKTNSYVIDTSEMTEGNTIQWRVRTAGITRTYGEWSVQRTVDVYAPATLSLSMTNSQNTSIEVLNAFPFYISAFAGPNTQMPVSYHLSVKADEVYETTDQIGNTKLINKGEEVFSKYYDTSEPLLVEMSAGNIDLENNITYTVTCVVSMNSGLTCTETLTFNVNWQDVTYEPDAEIGINKDAYVAYIRPYCVNDSGDIIDDVLLSVYRREYDGGFVELGTKLVNGANVHITDPHPALDYARYRIVATSKTNGSVSYYDPPGYPIHCKSVILQWDEAWSTFETGNSDAIASPAWAGSLLKLPYNIDVSDDNDIDVTMVKYIGRKNPVSYYGTQQGVTSTWSVVIPKSDTETLYALRRLAIWAGDVYVREPYGSGYWAHVAVSYDLKHSELTVPVTLNITRVEGSA